MDIFVDGIKNIVEAQQKVALQYFEEGSVEAAIPPLKILLHIMAYGHFEGKEIDHPELRKEFQREYVLHSEWYRERLKLKQQKDADLLKKQINYLKNYIENLGNNRLAEEMNLHQRLHKAEERLKQTESEGYLHKLVGTIGADKIFKPS
jgi:phosphoenolpyruvate carboxykinase (diphosphate)